LRAGDRITLGGHVLKVVALDHLERAFHETLLDQSTKDSLTGLANRAATLAELKTRFELALRHNRPLSVIMVDLDHFKNINDTYGHGAGDFILRSFGERVQERLRGADLAGRIGGEEFLLVLSETDTDGAMILAERIRSAMSDTPHLLQNGPLAATCSAGVAERGPSDRSPGDLMGRADAALYAAKSSGRNRVEKAQAS
jgi:diguanylate cyclase (GGDEF)-like protein